MKTELTPHEQYTIDQVKALLEQWPKTLTLELDEDDQTVVICKRAPGCPSYSASQVASFRKPTLFL